MRTNFDKITENVDILAEILRNADSCEVCSYYLDSYGCLCTNDKSCIDGIKEWLNKPLSFDEGEYNENK